MKVFKLIYKNLLRHKLRTLLTIMGITIAIWAYTLLSTVITAWYVGEEESAQDRLIVRHAVSFIFPLPLAYREQIMQIQGVTNISYANWFGGTYIDNSNFFARFAVDVDHFFEIYPEYLPDSKENFAQFMKERNSCFVGKKLAEKYNFKLGDIVTIKGDIFPGEWQFVVRSIYHGNNTVVDETQFFLHWKSVDERLAQISPGRVGNVGWYVVEVKDPSMVSFVSSRIDSLFKNSPAETKTETEKEFQHDFISMSGAIITAIRIISFIIIGVILLVLANTMIMTARERIQEYAVLKTLGFSSGHLFGLILGESMAIALTGGAIGILLTYPAAAGIGEQFSMIFPVFSVEPSTVILSGSFALMVGILSSIFPLIRALRTSIVDGLR